jgi:hypothetical protein
MYSGMNHFVGIQIGFVFPKRPFFAHSQSALSPPRKPAGSRRKWQRPTRQRLSNNLFWSPASAPEGTAAGRRCHFLQRPFSLNFFIVHAAIMSYLSKNQKPPGGF